MNVKDGWKTTEFWLTLISTIITAVVALGLLPADQGDTLKSGLTAVVTGVFMVAPVVVYIIGRWKVKQAALMGGK